MGPSGLICNCCRTRSAYRSQATERSHANRIVLRRFHHWGRNAVDGSRFPFEQRWPGVLQARLGNDYRIIEEGLGLRMVATESWVMPHRNGREMLRPILEAHAPLDWVIILLGTNDCAPMYHLSVGEIAFGSPRCSWTSRSRPPGRKAPRLRYSWSHRHTSANSRRSWSFSIAEPRRPTAGWRQRMRRSPNRVARIFWMRRQSFRRVQSMACIPTRTATANSPRQSRGSWRRERSRRFTARAH